MTSDGMPTLQANLVMQLLSLFSSSKPKLACNFDE